MIRKISAGILIVCSLSACSLLQKTPEEVMEAPILLDTIEVTPEVKNYNPSDRKVHDLIHTRLDVSFDWNKSQLNGVATLKLKPYFYPSARLILDAKGMDIHSVKLLTDSTNLDLEYTYDGRHIDIDLQKSYSRYEQYSIKIDYTAKPNDLPIGGSDAITSDKGLYFINPDSVDVNKPTQIWTQGQTESSSCWFPTIDSPNERMTQELFINVDERYKTVSNGTLVYSNYNADGSRTDYWSQELPHPPYLTMIAVGDFARAIDRWENSLGEVVPVNYYVDKEYANDAFRIFGNTPEMMSFYSQILGMDYPWEKYAQVVVKDYVSGAMENTSATIHGDFVQRTSRELLDGDYEDVIAHELFHHWFGDYVTCESWANLPLNESFATYGEYLWIEHKHGHDAAEQHGYESMMGYFSEARLKNEDLIRFVYADKEDMFDAHSYNKGGRVLHMLRYLVGDSAFFESLNVYLTDNALQDAEIHHLRLAFEKVTGQDLNWFFNQWFLNSGHPVLEITYFFDEERGQQILVRQTQGAEESDVFQLPLAIDIHVGDEVMRMNEFMTEQEEVFTYPLAQPASWINVDADHTLLAQKQDNRPDEWWTLQFRNSQNYLDRLEALEMWSTLVTDTLTPLTLEALQDPFWNIRMIGLNQLELAYDLPIEALDLLRVLAKADEKTQVRGKALVLMATFFPNQTSEELYVDAITKEQSYVVIAAGLKGLSILNLERAITMASTLEAERNFAIISAVAGLYEESGNKNKHAYFKQTLAALSGYEQYLFMRNYTGYLAGQENAALVDAVAGIESVGRNASLWWNRLAAYQALEQILGQLDARKAGLQEADEKAQIEGYIDGIQTTIVSMKKAEKDGQLLKVLEER
jgi:aminopeptidase N